MYRNRRLIIASLFAVLVAAPGCGKRPAADDAASSGSQKSEPVEVALDAEALYQTYCGSCHDGPVPKAPHLIKFAMFGADNILASMQTGVMKTQAAMLREEQKIALAEHLGNGKIAHVDSTPILLCESIANESIRSGSSIRNWGIQNRNTRFIDDEIAGLNCNDIT